MSVAPRPQITVYHLVSLTSPGSEVLLLPQGCTWCSSLESVPPAMEPPCLQAKVPKILYSSPMPAMLGKGLVEAGLWKSSPLESGQHNSVSLTLRAPQSIRLKPPPVGLGLILPLAWPPPYLGLFPSFSLKLLLGELP